MGLDVLIWGFGIAVFGVAARRAFDMISQERWRAMWIWFLVSFVPLGTASQVWAAMNNPPSVARWLILGTAGAAIGATLFIAVGEAVRSPTKAQNAPPSTTQSPPTVTQGPGSAYSSGQRGGITVGTLNVAPQQALSDLSNEQLRERASRFTAQLREFEAEHNLKESRISDQEMNAMLQQLPIRNVEDRERQNKKSQQNQSAMLERRKQYEAAFDTRFRKRALEFKEELCRREGIYPPYKFDLDVHAMGALAALDFGMLTGVNPVSGVSNFLDELIRKLPN